jgi:biopolymer transport protein ExbD
MASAASAGGDDEIITGINVTPLVDVTLVLLVILMVAAGYVAARGLPLDLPKAATAEAVPRTLTISVARDGATYLDGGPIEREALRTRVRAAARADAEIRAIIAADGRASHADVVRVIDLLRRESVTRFSLNVDPEELAP